MQWHVLFNSARDRYSFLPKYRQDSQEIMEVKLSFAKSLPSKHITYFLNPQNLSVNQVPG